VAHYIVKVEYPILSEPRYLAKDDLGWLTTDLDQCLEFVSKDEAEDSMKAFLVHIGKEGIPDVTAEVVEDQSFNPDWVTTPGSHIKEYFDEGLATVEDFLAKTGFTQPFLDELLRGEALITDEVAGKIAGVLRNSKQFWLNLEQNYREGMAKGLRVFGLYENALKNN
jgi:plasmid maintenance system antidote protein VapI